MDKNRNRFGPRRPQSSTTPQLIRLIVGLGLVLVFMYLAWQKAQEGPRNLGGPPAIKINQPAPGPNESTDSPPDSTANEPASNPLPNVHVEPERLIKTQIKNATIRNQDGKVIYRGNVDLTETLARIERNQRGSGNDGSVFQNREKRLPRKPAGYYHEWVHPTEGLRGPGPQRIVTGEDGEIYYTPDHYKTFERLDSEAGQGSGKGEQE